ncbi:unnamed protein product [Lymnaea stagnalis]|uniref:Fibronectin type III-like domain-containing protein n=1 Tax=Lymnaea stagnalis TaxID=6523 RepID=A0AAV2H1A2_LYMST
MGSRTKLCVFLLTQCALWTFVECSKSVLYFEPHNRAKGLEIFPFQNTSLPWNVRVDDLVSRLTLEEIQLQMARGGAGEYGGPAPAIPRLGIGAYQWDTECLRGDAETAENATAFPQAIGLSATFSPQLLYEVATAAGKEVRGKHNDYVKRGVYSSHTGASCFSPVINIVRDGRWGRAQETYGEDPYLSGTLSQSFVNGLQGNDPRYVQASAGCKHFDVHAGPEDIPEPRESFDAKVSDRDWRMTFLPAFRLCVRAGTFSVMCSYNRINGVPACANSKLLTDILRNEWNFTGYVVSDEQAIENIITRHHYLNNSVDTAAACVNAGCNLELSPNLPQPVYLSIVDAVNQGKLTEVLVRERVKPLFYTRMRLGEFDPPENNPYAQLSRSDVETPEHQALAVEAAAQSFVLLKNQNNTLPLKQDAYKAVAIVGPMADNYAQLFGDYTPQQDRSFTKTPLQGLRTLFPGIKYKQACADGTPCTSYQSQVIQQVVTGTDLVFVALGTGAIIESEGRDRPDLELPGHQKDLLLDVLKYSGNARIILLLFNAGPLNITFADESSQVDAILECFFPAQATGDAIANVLINKGGVYSPAGRLPITWPNTMGRFLPPMVNYAMEGRTYRYLLTDPLYPFGYGLSYSQFSYDYLVTISHEEPKQNLDVVLLFTNRGAVDADEVVQCYISWQNKTLPVPQRQLAYFNRINVRAGQQINLTFSVSWESWTFWDNDHKEVKWNLLPFQNTSLLWDDRVNDLVARLTLEEIQLQLARGGTGEFGSPAPGIPRLGIGPFAWDSECLHGAAREDGNATAFAQAIGLAASFSPSLIERVAAATGKEVRGKHNDFAQRGIYKTHTGLSCFSPVINVARDARWGRNQETYGEDPFMSGLLSQYYVRGLQGQDPRFVLASAGCKHFDAYSGPDNIPVTSISFDAQVSERDWRMTYLPAFKACVAAGTYSLMCSYNRINGVPACANKRLLTDVLRTEWGFKGYVISDQGAIEFIQTAHNYTNSSLETAVAALDAGCNLELSNNLKDPAYMRIVDAVHQGRLSESLVRERVKPLFYTRMRLGEFDPPEDNPYTKLDSSLAESPEHQALAVESAMKSFVLLKNRNSFLPLNPGSYHNVAIVGPMADNARQLFGDYSAVTDPSFVKTPLQGLRELFPSAKYENVCEDGNHCTKYRQDLVTRAVTGAELVFIVLGTGDVFYPLSNLTKCHAVIVTPFLPGTDVEMEGNDRPDLELPGHQKDLLTDALQSSGSASVVLLLFNAGPLNVSAADENDRVVTIMECFLPGQATGEALKNILTNTGQFGSPAGRVPITWPYHANQMPPMVNYSMEGRTYRYLKTDPLYPFGYGLSYTTFSYAGLSFPTSIKANESLPVSFDVSNSGSVDSDEVVQCYISWGDSSLPVPVRQLVYVDRVHVKAGQTVSVKATISGEIMAFWENNHWVIKGGTMNLYCGGQQPFQKKSAPSNVLSGQFTITSTLTTNKIV